MNENANNIRVKLKHLYLVKLFYNLPFFLEIFINLSVSVKTF